VLTNRRLLVHSGSGLQFDLAKSGGHVEQAQAGLKPFTGPEILGLRREELKKYPGAGHLHLGAADKEGTGAGVSLDYLNNVRAVEKMLREKLIHPFIDKLLTPRAPGEEKEAAFESDDPNVKAAPGSRRRSEPPPFDPNVRDFHSEDEEDEALPDPSSASPAAQEEAEAELTTGERILWIGRPDNAVRGRGVEGLDIEADTAHREEPRYRMYALTNRRALLFAEGAPISYYPPRLQKIQTEDDARVPDGGSVIFGIHIMTVTTQEKQSGKVLSTRATVTFTGYLRVRRYRAVLGLLRRTLLDPWLDRS
jgi:hypothetical protein